MSRQKAHIQTTIQYKYVLHDELSTLAEIGIPTSIQSAFDNMQVFKQSDITITFRVLMTHKTSRGLWSSNYNEHVIPRTSR